MVNFRIKIKIREQLSILVAFTAVTAVGILSLIFVCPSVRRANARDVKNSRIE